MHTTTFSEMLELPEGGYLIDTPGIKGFGTFDIEKEKADILTELDGKKATLQRSKGLGENDPEMMWMTTMNPDSRRLIRVMPTEAEATARVFDLLLGENAQGRKEHIAENGYKYLDLADIS